MFNCQHLYHPHQSDPGVSQRQRVIDSLLSDSIKIDGRSLADLLDYFQQLSRGIKYYDLTLAENDWQPFFKKSLPFLLASIGKFDDKLVTEKFELYKKFFDRSPSASGLQLIIYFIYYYAINTLYKWYESVKDHDLPLRHKMEELIRSKLASQLKPFIAVTNAAAGSCGIRRIDFTKFRDSDADDVWGLSLRDLYAVGENMAATGTGKCDKLRQIFDAVVQMFPPFMEGIKILAQPALDSIPISLRPLGDELKKDHAPHLALMFAFIQLFQKMQNELNKKTKDHLKFFYTEVLGIQPRAATSDRVNIIFEVQKILQNQYQQYKLAAGTQLNGGRDDNNNDVIFATDDEIVINETQLAEVRTLFLNNEEVFDRNYLEGLYMAPVADKADGADKDFPDDGPKNWYTVGNKYSKYIPPGGNTQKPYPAARLAFVLASTVLYMRGGLRTVDITLDCQFTDSACNQFQDAYCPADDANCLGYPNSYSASNMFDHVRDYLYDSSTNTVIAYIIISEELLQAAITRGMTETSAAAIRNRFLVDTDHPNTCTGEIRYKSSVVVVYTEWETYINTLTAEIILVKDETKQLPDLFKERYPFNIYFSGEKEWITPSSIKKLQLVRGLGNQFNFLITAVLEADKPPVVFFNRENLKEDIGTELPCVKVELDDALKIEFIVNDISPDCCLERIPDRRVHDVSLYHFFRNVNVYGKTRIDLTVCGLKNFIVQNDENVMDVNGIVFPFGTRPTTGAHFYISSNEVFAKNWSGIEVGFNWKDLPFPLPANYFKDYYHGYEDLSDPLLSSFSNNDFIFDVNYLDKGVWHPSTLGNHLLFNSDGGAICAGNPGNQLYKFVKTNFSGTIDYVRKGKDAFVDSMFRNDSRYGFLRLTLAGKDFQHSRYSFVLTRQMQAMGRYPEVYVGPIYEGINPITNMKIDVLTFDDLFKAIEDAYNITKSINNPRVQVLLSKIRAAYLAAGNSTPFNVKFDDVSGNRLAKQSMGTALNNNSIPTNFRFPPGTVVPPNQFPEYGLDKIENFLEDPILKDAYDKIGLANSIRVVVPNPPYTPQIQAMTMDYQASADVNDIDLIHLYPFSNTYKAETITLEPSLFARFCEEGTLFIGLKSLRPPINLSLLFQLAEATADSEAKPAKVRWHFLDNNIWKELRTGFEVLSDGTKGLTATGILKLALPENMSKINSVMPAGLHWIKATVGGNSRTVSETTVIRTQAMVATFQIDAALETAAARLVRALPPGSVGKLLVADPAVKSVQQPFDSFGGRLPELEGGYYQRVSELLRHKGRAIQKWDYERLVLEKFEQVYKAKCINHSFQTDAHLYENDVPYAPGYVLLALIPDLRILQAGNSFEPKVPASLLNETDQYFSRIISPFVRFKAVNPRYEKVHFCITVRLVHGKDEQFYKEKLKSDLRTFLAPWAVGKYDKLTFGQCVYRSDILRFLEQTGYIDFVRRLEMRHELDAILVDRPSVCPRSPRSVLVAGDVDINIDPEICDNWCIDKGEVAACAGPVLINDYCKVQDNENPPIN